MIFAYKYVANHPFERLHQYIEHLVLSVWCNPVGPFSTNKLEPEFARLVDAINDDLLLNPIERIYTICQNDLDDTQRDRLREGFRINNDVEGLCCGRIINPLTYKEIEAFHPSLSKELQLFFLKLYTEVPNREPIKKHCNGLLDHFRQFIGYGYNQTDYCAFCGYEFLKSEYEAQPHDLTDPITGETIRKPGKRDAYDHYLPKGTYPFSSVNLRNLAPACYNCNSSHKLQIDPVRAGRLAFYPYSTTHPAITFSVSFSNTDLETLTGDEVVVQFSCPGHETELDTWKELFGIEQRYRGIFSRKGDPNAWLKTFRSSLTRLRRRDPTMTVADHLPDYLDDMRTTVYQDRHFLKIAFLEGFEASGGMQSFDN